MDNGNGNGSPAAQKVVVNELVHGRDLVKQLQAIFLKEPSSSSNGPRDQLIQNILASFERSIGILQPDLLYQQQSQRIVTGTADSSNSFCESPISPDSDGDFKDLHLKDEPVRKRKLLPLETKRVQGCSRTGLEGPVEDGYNWRKYGQKDILGAKFPRAYYRCTLRQVQRCFATKHVQRCDDDPTFFEVTYRGKHSCTQAASSSSFLNPTDFKVKTEPIETLTQHSHHQHSHETIWSFKTEQKDIKPSSTNNRLLNSSSFSFSSSRNPTATTQKAPTEILHNNNLTDHGNFTTNINTYQQSSPSLIANSFNNQLAIHSERDLTRETDIVASASNSSSTAMAPEFLFDQGDFPHNFMLFDSPEFYP